MTTTDNFIDTSETPSAHQAAKPVATDSPKEMAAPNPFEDPAHQAISGPDVNVPINLSANPTTPDIEETPTIDPRVAALKAMFPDFDDLVLQSVLEEVDWNQDRAIDALLGMSDPNYKPDVQPSRPPAPSQTELDEQFARRLLLEEQQQEEAAWQATHPQPPRTQSTQGAYPQQSAGMGGNQMAEFTEQFNRVAEAGRRTFGNIMTKVKAKIQEFDTNRQSQASTQPTWGGSPYAASSPPNPNMDARYNYNNYYAPSQPQSQPPTQYQPQSSTQYQPANPVPNPTSQSDLDTTPAPRSTSTASASTLQAYDLTPEMPSTSPPTAASPLSTSNVVSATTAAPTSTGPATGTPIDGGKLGLLPKRPVSLLRTNEPQQIQRQESVSDDGLEYAENPFEEGSRR